MKSRLHDKMAGIAILVTLIIISLADMMFRIVSAKDMAFTTSNLGEQLAVIVLAVTILVLTLKGNDRACYLCYGAWGGYFILDQFFELPGLLISFVPAMRELGLLNMGNVGFLLHIVSAITIFAIGVLLVEYMNDGTIYNKAFNTLSVITVLAIFVSLLVNIHNFATVSDAGFMFVVFNNMYRLTMIFMLTFFAYDSAKHQLKKVNFSD